MEETEGDPQPVTENFPADDSSDGVIGKQHKHTRISISRLFDIRPTIGIPGVYCRSCEEGIGKHSKGCKDRFDKGFEDAAGSEAGKKLEKLPRGNTSAVAPSASPSDETKGAVEEQLSALLCEA